MYLFKLAKIKGCFQFWHDTTAANQDGLLLSPFIQNQHLKLSFLQKRSQMEKQNFISD